MKEVGGRVSKRRMRERVDLSVDCEWIYDQDARDEPIGTPLLQLPDVGCRIRESLVRCIERID
jgi:hypothetical protein